MFKAKFSLFLYIFFLLWTGLVSAQSLTTCTGVVSDAATGETLIGATVLSDDGATAITDEQGRYTIAFSPGRRLLTFSYVGYESTEWEVGLKQGETKTVDIKLYPSSNQLDVVVVSGSKYQRNINEETVSIGVITQDLFINSGNVTPAEGIGKIPGVIIQDNQINIRGGSGYTLGAGSRVLLLVDDMPLLSVDRGEIRWNYIPLEIMDQIEVVKSASSALYGASAINGVLSIHTSWPKSEPETEAMLYYTTYASPRRDVLKWWSRDSDQGAPYKWGGYFAHQQRFGNFDIVVSANAGKNESYIRALDDYFYRLNFKLRHRVQKVKGLQWGLNFNAMEAREAFFYFWNDYDETYIPSGSTGPRSAGNSTFNNRVVMTLDPRIDYHDKFNNHHSIRLRYNRNYIGFNSENPLLNLFFGEYQFQRSTNIGLRFTAGANGQYVEMKQSEALGIHSGTFGALYAQLDYSLRDRLTVTLGGRAESFRIDSTYKDRIVGSTGVNYRVGKATNIRAAVGQGFRFPSIAERFASENLSAGGLELYIFPNPAIKPEFGFNAEIALVQGIVINEWKSFIDFSLFWMEYWDMVDFVFGSPVGIEIPVDAPPLGFQSQNVSRARIAGYEISWRGEGLLGNLPLRFQSGYTYNYPVELTSDTTLARFGNYMKNFFKSIPSTIKNGKNRDVLAPLLKYRFRHQLSFDLEFDVGRFTLGTEVRAFSFTEAVDGYLAVAIPSVLEYRVKNTGGEAVWNLRAFYNMGEEGKFGRIGVIVNNVTNNEYSIRPARMEAPLNFTVQYRLKIGKRGV